MAVPEQGFPARLRAPGRLLEGSGSWAAPGLEGGGEAGKQPPQDAAAIRARPLRAFAHHAGCRQHSYMAFSSSLCPSPIDTQLGSLRVTTQTPSKEASSLRGTNSHHP